MHTGGLVFAQLMDHLPPMVFERCVARYGGNHKVKSFTCKISSVRTHAISSVEDRLISSGRTHPIS